jgi:hypothetical protein
VLYSFHGAGDGRIPNAGLFPTTNGIFYGTALMGGNTNTGFGTVYGFTLVPVLNLIFSNPSAPTLTLTGFANQSCQVQVSSNLINWDFLENVVLTNGSAQIMDANAPQTAGRFYRAVIP